MKRSLFVIPVFFWGTLGCSQTSVNNPSSPNAPHTQSQSPSPSAGPASQQLPKGPEAIAQQDPNRVVATIAGKPITAKQVMDLLRPVPPQERKRLEANLQTVVQQLYMQGQIADEAVKMNLDQQSPWKEQLQLARANILTQAYVDKMANNGSAPSADPKQYYDSHSAEFDQVKVSGILVTFTQPGTPAANANTARTEAQAEERVNELEKKLKGGGDLATLARTDSDDQVSAAKGGELGTFAMAEPKVPNDIKAAVGKLQPGQISEPVRVNGGFYILKLESRTKVPLEQARAAITQRLQNERGQTVLNQERDKYKLQVQDPEFFNASNAPANIPSLQRPGSPNAGPVKPPVK